MRFCTKCGSQIPDDAQFCAECGAKIIEEVEENVTVKNIDVQQPTNVSPVNNSDAIVLQSADPIPSRIISDSSADNIGSIGMLISFVGFVLQFIDALNRIGHGLMAVGLTGVLINHLLYWKKGRTEKKDLKIMREHLPEIREMKFKFFVGVSAGAIYEKILPAIKSQYENKFEFDRQNETVALIYEKMIYKIILNDDNTFCIWWARLDNKPLDKINVDDTYPIYSNVLSCTGIIAYELQKQFWQTGGFSNV